MKPHLLLLLLGSMFVVSCSDNTNKELILDYNGENHRYGYIDSLGNIEIPYEYYYARPFDGNVAIVTERDHNDRLRRYLIDKNGKQISKQKFYRVGDFHNGVSIVSGIDDGYGYIDKKGKLLTPLKYYITYSFSNGLSLAEINDKAQRKSWYVYVDTLGNEALTLDDTYYASSFSEGLAAVGKSHEYERIYGYMDTEGNLAIPFQFSAAGPFSEGLAAVRVGNKWGFIDKTGKIVIEPQFNDALYFSEGRCAVEATRWGYINTQGELVIPCILSKDNDRSYFNNDRVIVTRGADSGVIDRNGNVIIPIAYRSIERIGSRYFEVYNYQGNALFDYDGNRILPFEYQEIYSVCDNGLVAVKKGGCWGFVDMDNNIVVPIKYPDAESFDGPLAFVGDGFVDESGNFYKSKRDYILQKKP